MALAIKTRTNKKKGQCVCVCVFLLLFFLRTSSVWLHGQKHQLLADRSS